MFESGGMRQSQAVLGTCTHSHTAAPISSLSAPERFFKKVEAKVDAGHHDFAVAAKVGEVRKGTINYLARSSHSRNIMRR